MTALKSISAYSSSKYNTPSRLFQVLVEEEGEKRGQKEERGKAGGEVEEGEGGRRGGEGGRRGGRGRRGGCGEQGGVGMSSNSADTF